METIMRGLMGVSPSSQEDGYLIYCPKAEDVGDRFMEEDFTWELEDDYTKDDKLGMQMVAQSLFRDGNANSSQSGLAATELPSKKAPAGDKRHREQNHQVERALPNFAFKAEIEPQYDSPRRKRFVTEHRPGQVLDPHHKTSFEGQSVIKTEAIDSASSYHIQGGMTADARGIVETDAHGQTVIRIQSENVGLLNTHQPGYKPPVDQLSSHIMRPVENTSQTPHGQVSQGLYSVVKSETATVDPMHLHDSRRWMMEDAQGATEGDDKRPTWTAVPSPDVDVTCRTAVDRHSRHDPLRNTPQTLHQNGQSVPDVVEGPCSVAKAVTVDSTHLLDDRGGMPSDPGHGTTERTSELKPKFNEHTETCSCGTCFTPPPIYARTRVIREKPRQCPFCDKAFAYPSQLKRHMLNHTGEKLFQCPVCDKGFTQKTSLTSHMVIHTGEKHFECDVCQKAFSHRSSLQSHKRTHTGERPYQCGLCQKRFLDRRHLSRHMTLHTGERRYKCTLCTKAFSQGHNLTLHMRHHRGERNFECSSCHMKFYTNQHLTSHMRSHTGERPYRCEECGKDFSHASSLYVHKRIHKGAKPYTCSICNKQFTQGGSLNRHMKTHTEAKP